MEKEQNDRYAGKHRPPFPPAFDKQLTELDKQCIQYFRTDATKAIETALQMLAIAETTGDDGTLGHCYHKLGSGYRQVGDTQAAIEYYQRALVKFRSIGDRLSIAYVLGNLSHIYLVVEDHRQALQYGREGLAIIEEIGSPTDLGTILGMIGSMYVNIGKYERGIEFTLQGIEQCSKGGHTLGVATLYNNLGVAYTSIKDYQKAFECHKQALNIRKEIDDVWGQSLSYANLAECVPHVHSHEPDIARYARSIEYLDHAMKICRQVGDQYHEAKLMISYGAAFRRQGYPDKAIEYLHDGKKRLEKLAKDEDWNAEAINELGRAYRDAGEREQAKEYFRTTIDTRSHRLRKVDVIAAYRELSGIFEQENDYRRSLEHYKTYSELKEEKINQKKLQKITAMHIHFDVERLHKERELEKKEKELAQIRAQQLEQTVELKIKQATSSALILAQKNEFLISLHKMLTKVIQSPEETRQSLSTALQEIKNNITIEQTWKAFHREFEQLHSGFIATLAKRYPTLTGTELKLCAFLKIHLTSKDISRLLNIGVRSVEVYRHRVRKKLGLAQDVHLATFLSSF